MTEPEPADPLLEAGLTALFAAARPDAALEDRMIRTLRGGPPTEPRRIRLTGWPLRLTAGLAASAGLGVAGWTALELVDVPFPGEVARGDPAPISEDGLHFSKTSWGEVADGRALGRRSLKSAVVRSLQLPDMTNSDAGIDSNLKAAVEVDRGEDPNVDAKVVQDAPIGLSASPGAAHAAKLYFLPSTGKDVIRSTDGTAAVENETRAKLLDAIVPTAGRSKGDVKLVERFGEALPAGTDDFRLGGVTGRGVINAPVVAGQAPKPAIAADPAPAAGRKIVIRTGDITFEVESFDAAAATITKLIAAIPTGYVGTVNSEKLPNGKVKGTVVVRVPPEKLDALVLDLRADLGKGGELKGLRIGSQDITKQYTDLESRLKAARTMETRLLEIIKTGKGEIKQLLEAEKELGVWRTKIEEFEGEMRYLGSQAAMSTLTIILGEKDIRTAAGVTESERVQAGVEVEDVEVAQREMLAAVAEAKGRVQKAEVKQLPGGQFNATLNCEVPPAAAGPLRDRLKQLGRVARLEVDRVQSSDGPAPRDAKVTRGETQFLLQFYNLANVEPRETAGLTVATANVPAAYQSLRDAVTAAKGRVLTARLVEADRGAVTGFLDFDIRRADEAAVRAAIAAAGEVLYRNVTRAPDTDAVTDSKLRFRVQIDGLAKIPPRETTTLTVEVPDVDAAAALAAAHLAEVGGRTVDSRISHERSGQATAKLVYDVPLASAAGFVEKLKAAGIVRAQQSSRNQQAPEGKLATTRVDVTLGTAEVIVSPEDGLWPQVRRGLAFSAQALLKSLTWVIFGLCVVLPWAGIGYAGYRLVRRIVRPATVPAA